MAELDFDRLLDDAALIARRVAGARWRSAANAFRRDITSFDWRTNGVLTELGVPHRSYASKDRIPGRLAFVHAAKDAPAVAACEDFLARGGTLVIDGKELLDALELDCAAKALSAGAQTVQGAAIDALGFPDSMRTQFWADPGATTIDIEGADVRVRGKRGPLVSRVAHRGGTLVVLACTVSGYERKSGSKTKVAPAALATELGSAIDFHDAVYPRDLLAAHVTMISVLGDVIATALA